MGELDSTPADTTVVVADIADAARLGLVNGPEDLLDWDHLDWRDQERRVQRLRHRISRRRGPVTSSGSAICRS